MRPRIRIPIVAALAIVVAAYIGRSVFLRHGDFSLNVTDVIVLGLALAAIAAVAWLRATGRMTEGESPEDSPSDAHSSDSEAR